MVFKNSFRSMLWVVLMLGFGLTGCAETPDKETLGVTCEYDGKEYAAGESFDANDDCNTCSCLEDGQAVCTLMACETEGACEDQSCSASCIHDDGCDAVCDLEGTCVCGSADDLCTEDLCANVTCENTGSSCEGTWVHNGSYSDCDPSSGECVPGPGLPPEDCAELGMLCDDGACVPGPCTEKICGEACDDPAADCGESYCDLSGQCACQPLDEIECTEDLCAVVTCDSGMICVHGECMEGFCGDKACGEACVDPAADCDESYCDSAGYCLCQPLDEIECEDPCVNVDCGMGDACIDGECVMVCGGKACGEACDDPVADCAESYCDANGACLCQPLAEIECVDSTCPDNDGDGHSDVRCGGDDCDDNDRFKHPTHPEVWDVRDNDCDGRSDEDGVVRRNRYFKNWGSNDWEHRFMSAAQAGWESDGRWVKWFPASPGPCSQSNPYRPLDGCQIQNGGEIINLWGGFTLVAIKECSGDLGPGWHITLYLTEGSSEANTYSQDSRMTCRRVAYVYGGNTHISAINSTPMYRHRSDVHGDNMWSPIIDEGNDSGYENFDPPHWYAWDAE